MCNVKNKWTNYICALCHVLYVINVYALYRVGLQECKWSDFLLFNKMILHLPPPPRP